MTRRRFLGRVFGYDVFISYRRSEMANGYASRLYEELLRADRYRVFMDTREIAAGDKLRTILLAAVRRSSVLVLLLDGDAHRSDWVRDEVREAINRSRKVVTVDLCGRLATIAPPGDADLSADERSFLQPLTGYAWLGDVIGGPGSETIGELERLFTFRRRATYERIALWITALVTTGLAIGLGIAAYLATASARLAQDRLRTTQETVQNVQELVLDELLPLGEARQLRRKLLDELGHLFEVLDVRAKEDTDTRVLALRRTCRQMEACWEQGDLEAARDLLREAQETASHLEDCDAIGPSLDRARVHVLAAEFEQRDQHTTRAEELRAKAESVLTAIRTRVASEEDVWSVAYLLLRSAAGKAELMDSRDDPGLMDHLRIAMQRVEDASRLDPLNPAFVMVSTAVRAMYAEELEKAGEPEQAVAQYNIALTEASSRIGGTLWTHRHLSRREAVLRIQLGTMLLRLNPTHPQAPDLVRSGVSMLEQLQEQDPEDLDIAHDLEVAKARLSQLDAPPGAGR